MKRFPQNQCTKLKEHFREHPYYKLCKTVFNIFQVLHPTMVMTPEQLFVDASQVLDNILITRDLLCDQCQNLWTDKYNEYREQDGNAGDKDDTKTEVAMLFYMVMYGLTTVKQSHFCGKLTRILHESIHKFYGRKDCFNIERKLHEHVNQHSDEMREWMEDYFKSKESLTIEIDLLLHSGKKVGSKKKEKKKEIIFYTLPYNCPDEHTRVNRVNIVMRKMQEWKWIEEPNIVDDFDHFFDGEPRNCNLKWIGNLYIISELLKQLLKQHYMNKMKGVSARSIVINQFGLTPSGNKERLDALDLERINIIKYILDYNKPLPLPYKGKGEGSDISDLALQAVFAKELHITKDLNRTYD